MNINALFAQFRRETTDDASAAILTLAAVLADQEPELLTVKQAAARLNVSTDCVYQMVEAGKLRHHRVGKGRGTIRIRPADLDSPVVPLADLIR